MSRINTNVSSLIAQNTLGRNNNDLQTALGRLSTGLRINSGADDPAGLIASENLRRDITAIERAISNSERAGQLIATADSALGQVSNLLNDIRGLVTEAANSGALSDEQIAANQLQVDSSLEAIDRIAQVTTFQGRRVLDGSLDFITQSGTGFSTISDLTIDQANLGATGAIDVNVEISAAATQAQLTETGDVTSVNATARLTFTAGGTSAALTNGGTITVQANQLGNGDGVQVQLVNGGAGAGETAVFDAENNAIVVTVDASGGAGNSTLGDVVTAIDTSLGSQFTASATLPLTDVDALDAVGTIATLGEDHIDFTAAAIGPDFNDVSVVVQGGGANGATFNSATNVITVTIDNTGAAQDVTTVAATLDGDLTGFFNVAAVAGGDTDIGGDPAGAGGAPATADFTATGDTGNTGSATLADSVTFRLNGFSGSEVFSFASGTAYAEVAAAINLVSDATGVSATETSAGDLQLTSTEFGTKSFVDVEVVSEGALGTFASNLSANRNEGTDASATINGTTANADGNKLSLNTSVLDLSFNLTAGSTTDVNFTITGGGAVFQLGPSVVSNQQAQLGIGSISTADLGGATGRLFELRSGNGRALATDSTGAADIVDETITKVSQLRGRLGAFQRTTLRSNINSLQDTLVNLTDAESSIRDADFAKESASLTRAQILVQSGTSVLAIANQNPQNVLALLR
jgi:flagellin